MIDDVHDICVMAHSITYSFSLLYLLTYPNTNPYPNSCKSQLGSKSGADTDREAGLVAVSGADGWRCSDEDRREVLRQHCSPDVPAVEELGDQVYGCFCWIPWGVCCELEGDVVLGLFWF